MNIYFESPQRLKIELSGTDLSELGITYDELDYSTERTRSVVNELLSRIGADEEFGASSKRIIEIFPHGEDGCTMYFTTVREGTVTVRKRSHDTTVWEIDGADALYKMAEALRAHGTEMKISLYLYADKYRLIINEHISRNLVATLGEFARKCGERYSALFTLEHGKILSGDLLGDLL